MIPKIPYVKRELEVVEEIEGRMGMKMQIKNTPVSPRQNTQALFWDRKPCWMPGPMDFTKTCIPDFYNNHLGRGGAEDTTDDFGLVWEYVEAVGGSIVHPGKPLMEDVNEWKEKIILPDIDTYDWEGAAKTVKIDQRYSTEMSFINGFWFERLISFMDFEGAAMALLDEDQEDAIHELFTATTDLACRLVDKFCEYFPMMDGFNVHDDWGAQKAPFFSQEIAYEFFVPYMKKLTDHIHSKGRYATLHSCGHNAMRIQAFIDGGFDQWTPQLMNDVRSLYENYGDKIVLGVFPDRDDIASLSEDEQRAEARRFADTYCKPGKPAVLSIYGGRMVTPVFMDELYEYSRKLYLKQ